MKSAPLTIKRGGPLTQELLREPGGFGLGQVVSHRKPDAVTSMVCGFCSTGCSLDIHIKDGKPVGLSPTTNYAVNQGMACPKGWEALTPLRAHDRATTPLWRDAKGKLQPIGWEPAIRTFVDRFKTIIAKHGPESVAFISTGQIPTEEMAFLGALTKFGMGLVHGDGNTRQCMATSVVAYKQSFGFDAPPYTYADFEESDVIVLVGSNLCIAHPIMWERICKNKNNPEVIVIDPRVTETATAATQHVALRAKSDLALFYGIAHVLISKDWIDRNFIEAHTTGFDDFALHVADFPPSRVQELSGVSAEAIEELAATIHAGKRVSLWWTMGVNQGHEATRTAQAIINIALMTGNIGRPGTGANSITGQCNAMGSRLFSNTTNLFGGRDFANDADRQHVADVLGIDAAVIPNKPSYAYDQIISGVQRGDIKGLWVIATNSAHSWIDQHQIRAALSGLDTLVVQDMYTTTETAQMADLVLPAAGWGEKEGTFINSERRVGVIKRVAQAPGNALSDFSIFALIAQAWGCADLFERWTSPEAVFDLVKALSKGRPCDISGIADYVSIDAAGGIQWPYAPDSDGSLPVDGQRRLFANGQFFHPDRRARFLFDQPRPVAEPTTEVHPLVLLTGRGSASQWHTGSRTSKSTVLRSLSEADPYVEISPHDAEHRSIGEGDSVVIVSARGSMRATASVSSTVSAGEVFVPMHYPEVNRLTNASFDPHSRQPSYKSCAVEVRRAGWRDR
jgi:assimilatory nitrate reductase catalytic subunit